MSFGALFVHSTSLGSTVIQKTCLTIETHIFVCWLVIGFSIRRLDVYKTFNFTLLGFDIGSVYNNPLIFFGNLRLTIHFFRHPTFNFEHFVQTGAHFQNWYQIFFHPKLKWLFQIADMLEFCSGSFLYQFLSSGFANSSHKELKCCSKFQQQKVTKNLSLCQKIFGQKKLRKGWVKKSKCNKNVIARWKLLITICSSK